MSSHDRDPHYNAHFNSEEVWAGFSEWNDQRAAERFIKAQPVTALHLILAALKEHNNQ